jgi:hypothetical protein
MKPDKPRSIRSYRITDFVVCSSSSDIHADIASRWDCQEYYGLDTWFAGHRNGASGIANPNTPDIAGYREAITWIQAQIDSNPIYTSDDTRFWVDVVPI